MNAMKFSLNAHCWVVKLTLDIFMFVLSQYLINICLGILPDGVTFKSQVQDKVQGILENE